jgi:UDP-4-amino-4-deoxy-L-arabinose-oxoglutarate aminotransferase
MKIRPDFLPLSRPALGAGEEAAVVECLRSGWITSGPKVQELEEIFREATGAPHAVAVTSATAGLHIVLAALGIGPGDEVVTPSLTFASTVNQVALRGAAPVFADCDYGTLQVVPGDLAAKITPRTKAVIPVHFAGAPADLDPIRDAAGRAGVPVIEDAAHAVGTSYKGVPVGGPAGPGSPGNIAVFSFHPIKNITTGEGGMVTCHDDALAARLRLLRFHGIERDAWKRYGKGGTPHYDIREPGYKYNLTDLHAALGVVQMGKVAALNARRTELAERYRAGLRGVAGIDLPETAGYPHVHSWHLFIVKVTAMGRDDMIAGLAERNVGVGLHFPPCHLLSYVRERFGTKEGELVQTELAGGRILSLPLFPGMSDDDVDYVCEAAREILLEAAR